MPVALAFRDAFWSLVGASPQDGGLPALSLLLGSAAALAVRGQPGCGASDPVLYPEAACRLVLGGCGELGILTAVKPMRVLLFDVFGTLVDWRSSLIDLAEATAVRAGVQADWAAVVDDWRRAYQPAMDGVRRGAPWRDLDSLQRETLDDVLARRKIRLVCGRPGSACQGLAAAAPLARQPRRTRSPAPQVRHGHAIERPSRLARGPAQVRRPARGCRAVGAACRRLTSPTPACTSPRFASSIASLRMPRWWPRTRQTCTRPPRSAFARSTSAGPWSGVPARRPRIRRAGRTARNRRTRSARRITWAADRSTVLDRGR